jgi:hypothetical protein
MQYVTKTTPELEQGDIVNCHGLRCLIDSEPQVSKGHPTNENSPTMWTQALVLNRDAVPTEIVPVGWTADWKRPYARTEPLPHDGQHRWTIQGNKLATWAVEIPPACPDCGSTSTKLYPMSHEGDMTLYCDTCKREEPV